MPVILIYLLISIILVTVILPVWTIRGLEKKNGNLCLKIWLYFLSQKLLRVLVILWQKCTVLHSGGHGEAFDQIPI